MCIEPLVRNTSPPIRTNIEYRVVEHEEPLSKPDTLARDIKERHAVSGPKLTIVYIAHKSGVQNMTEILGCLIMDSTTTDKEGVLVRFRAAVDAILLATSSSEQTCLT
jgi:hypothetical protein